MLETVDNLERALTEAKGDEKESSLYEGVSMVYENSCNTFKRFNVDRIVLEDGEIFDP